MICAIVTMINGTSLHNWLTWHRITSATYILFFRDLELWIKSARGRHSLKSCLNAGLCVTWRRGQDGGSGRRAVLLIPSYSPNPSGIVTFMSQLWQCGLNALLSKSCSDRHYYCRGLTYNLKAKWKSCSHLIPSFPNTVVKPSTIHLLWTFSWEKSCSFY